MEKFRCPGEHNKECGKIVNGNRHQTELSVAVLDEHPDCARRYVYYNECVVKNVLNPRIK